MSSIFAQTVRDHETRAERCKCYACVSYDRDGNFIGNRVKPSYANLRQLLPASVIVPKDMGNHGTVPIQSAKPLPDMETLDAFAKLKQERDDWKRKAEHFEAELKYAATRHADWKGIADRSNEARLQQAERVRWA